MDKSIVFSVENIGSEETIKKLAELKLVFKQLTKDIADANKADNKKLFSELTVAQEKVKVAIQETNKELKNQKKEFETSKYPTDSLRSLEQSYAKVATQIRNMSAAQRESLGGKTLISSAKGIKDQINSVSQSFGDTSKNIGNYAESIGNALQSPLSTLKSLGTVGAIAGLGIEAFQSSKVMIDAFDEAARAATKLLTALDGNREAAKRLETQANQLSVTTLFNDEDIINGQAILATLGFTEDQIKKLTPRILDYAQANDKDLKSSFLNVGKTINGTAAANEKLTLSFGNAKSQAERTKITVDGLNKSFGGQAIAAANAGSAPLKQMGKAWGELQESIGGSIVRITTKIFPNLSKGIDDIKNTIFAFIALGVGVGSFVKHTFINFGNEIGKFADDAQIIGLKVKDFFLRTNSDVKIKELEIDKKDLDSKYVDPFKKANKEILAEFGRLNGSIIDQLETPTGTEKSKGKKELTPEQIATIKKAEEERLLKLLEAQKKHLTEVDQIVLSALEEREQREKEFIDRHIELIKKGQINEVQLIQAFAKERIKILQDESARREGDNVSIVTTISTKNIDGNLISEKDLLKDENKVSKHVQKLSNIQDKFNDEQAAKRKQIQEDKDQDRKDQIKQSIKDSEVEAISGIDNLLQIQLDKEQAAADKIKNARLISLSDEYTKKKAYAQGNSELLIKLNQEEAEKRAKIEKEEAKKSQQIAIKRALIDGAAAILKTFATLGFPAGLFASIPLAVATGLQIAAIKSQKFDKGGFTGIGSNQIDSSGKRVAGVVHANEYVAPDDQIVRYPNLFHWLNDERINKGVSPSFEVGGFTSPLKKIPSIMQVLSPTRFDRALSVPQVIVKFPEQTKRDTEKQFAYFNDEQIAFQTKQLYNASLEGSKRGTAEGLQEANRRILREQILKRKLTS